MKTYTKHTINCMLDALDEWVCTNLRDYPWKDVESTNESLSREHYYKHIWDKYKCNPLLTLCSLVYDHCGTFIMEYGSTREVIRSVNSLYNHLKH